MIRGIAVSEYSMATAKFAFVIFVVLFVDSCRAIEVRKYYFLLSVLRDYDGVFVVASFLHVCRRYDPRLQQCLTATVEGLRPFLAKGT